MKVYYGIDKVPENEATIIVAGIFDGLHLGHRALFEMAEKRACHAGAEVRALTFYPHPSSVLSPADAPPLICTLDRRLELMAETGLIDSVVVIEFNRELARMSCRDFAEKYLFTCGMKEIVTGYDFTFGRDRAGNTDTLRELGRQKGFEVHVVPPISIGDGLVPSSTRVRELISSGDVFRAGKLLGRPYRFRGKVIKGEGRGSKIGFPTANIETEAPTLLPAGGVYAVRVRGDFSGIEDYDEGRGWIGAMNRGTNPSFTDGKSFFTEVHIPDYKGDSLLGSFLEVDMIRRIRDERKFSSAHSLVLQINKDIEKIRRYLCGQRQNSGFCRG